MPGLVRSGMLASRAAAPGRLPGRRVRIAIAGGGLIAQAAHLPNLLRLRDYFEIVGVSDPSARVRAAIEQRFGVTTVATFEEAIDALGAEALLVCTPQGLHADQSLTALDAGLHVLVEKPLCLVAEDAQRIADAAERAGLVAMVAYMKQYDPTFAAMRDALPANADDLRFIDVVTFDPIMARPPFFRPGEIVWADDVPASDREAAASAEREQVTRAFGDVPREHVSTFSNVFAGALSHDLSTVHALLRRMGEPLPAAVVAGATWADGDAAAGTLQLTSGARWNLTWTVLEGLQHFEERLVLHFADAIHELTFPAPYLGWPAVYSHVGTAGLGATRMDRTEPGEAFLLELSHFHACVVDGVASRTPAADAVVDVLAACDLFQHAIGTVAAAGRG